MAYTTTNLVTEIERRSFAPAGQTTMTTDEILAIATEELKEFIFPAIIGVKEEYFVYYETTTLTSGTDRYRTPARAWNEILREVKLLRGQNFLDIPRMSPEDVPDSVSGSPDRFILRNNDVVLYPNPNNSTDVLYQYYFLTPGDLIQTSSAAVISAINTSTNVVTVTSIPSSWATGDIFDLVKASGAQEYLQDGISLTSTLVSGSDITLPSLPSTLAVGDYICPEGQSALVQCPSAMRGVLAQHAAAGILEYMNQPNATKMREKATAMLEIQTNKMIPRVEGESEYITQTWF